MNPQRNNSLPKQKRSDTSSPSTLEYLDRYPIILPSFMLDTTRTKSIQDDASSSSIVANEIQTKQKDVTYPKGEITTRLAPNDSNDRLGPMPQTTNKALKVDRDWHKGWDSLSKTIAKDQRKYKKMGASSPDDTTTSSSQTSQAAAASTGRPLSSSSPTPSQSSSSEGSLSPVLAYDSESPSSPKDADIICTRGRAFLKHPGNIRFRTLIQKYVHQYTKSNRRFDRSIVINSLLAEIHDHPSKQQVRLLKWDNANAKWETLDDCQTRDKISHALRFAFQEQPEQGGGATSS